MKLENRLAKRIRKRRKEEREGREGGIANVSKPGKTKVASRLDLFSAFTKFPLRVAQLRSSLSGWSSG